jgi:hypothetical protein
MLNPLALPRDRRLLGPPELAPPSPITGAAAFRRYIEHTFPCLHESAGELSSPGTGGDVLIGPPGARRDRVMLVQRPSVESFVAFAAQRDHLAGLGHQVAAREDARLRPLSELAAPPATRSDNDEHGRGIETPIGSL